MVWTSVLRSGDQNRFQQWIGWSYGASWKETVSHCELACHSPKPVAMTKCDVYVQSPLTDVSSGWTGPAGPTRFGSGVISPVHTSPPWLLPLVPLKGRGDKRELSGFNRLSFFLWQWSQVASQTECFFSLVLPLAKTWIYECKEGHDC